jgi:hypothetical protein
MTRRTHPQNRPECLVQRVTGESQRRGPLPAAPYRAYGASRPFGSQRPSAKIDPRSRWRQSVHWMQWGERGTRFVWDPWASGNSDAGLSEARDKSLTPCAEKGTRCAVGGARTNVQSPSHSLRSCSAPAGPLLASLKSAAAVSRFRSGDQRLISRGGGPMGNNCFAAALTVAPPPQVR